MNSKLEPLFPEAKSGIHIKKSHEGRFTNWANRHGFSSVQAAASHVMANKDDYSSHVVQMVNFAKNAKSWDKSPNGTTIPGDSTATVQDSLENLEPINRMDTLNFQGLGPDDNLAVRTILESGKDTLQNRPITQRMIDNLADESYPGQRMRARKIADYFGYPNMFSHKPVVGEKGRNFNYIND